MLGFSSDCHLDKHHTTPAVVRSALNGQDDVAHKELYNRIAHIQEAHSKEIDRLAGEKAEVERILKQVQDELESANSCSLCNMGQTIADSGKTFATTGAHITRI